VPSVPEIARYFMLGNDYNSVLLLGKNLDIEMNKLHPYSIVHKHQCRSISSNWSRHV